MMSEHNLKLNIEFESIKGTLKQIDALYDLLKKREHNISHQSLPTFEEHEIFVKSLPYKKWYLVTSQDGYIGSCYLDYNNSIGLNLIDESPEVVRVCIEFIENGHNLEKEVKSKIPPYFYVNVPHNNERLKKSLESIGMVRIQTTFSRKQ